MVKTLTELGVLDNTLIVFSSDNGGEPWVGGRQVCGQTCFDFVVNCRFWIITSFVTHPHHPRYSRQLDHQSGLRGIKVGAWDGSSRVPAFVKFPESMRQVWSMVSVGVGTRLLPFLVSKFEFSLLWVYPPLPPSVYFRHTHQPSTAAWSTSRIGFPPLWPSPRRARLRGTISQWQWR